MFGKTDFVLHISCIGGIALPVVVIQSLELTEDDGNVVADDLFSEPCQLNEPSVVACTEPSTNLSYLHVLFMAASSETEIIMTKINNGPLQHRGCCLWFL